MVGTILLVLVCLAIVGTVPEWQHSRNWGYYPMGGLIATLLLLETLIIFGRL
jgi:hypothetical protein